MTTQAELLRQRLRNRKNEKRERKLLRFPFILDDDLASSIHQLTMQYEALVNLVESRKDRLEAAEENGEVDVRASGHDTSGFKDSLEAAEKELARVRAELEAQTEKVNEGRFWMEFRPCDASTYEQVLARFPGVDDENDVTTRAEFGNALLEKCFVRFEQNGETLDLGTWAEFVAEADMDFGELDPIRTAIFVACNRNPHSLLAG